MLKSFFLVALRQMLKNKLQTAINILGFSLGLTVTLILTASVIDEVSFDRFNPDIQRIYRLLTVGQIQEGELDTYGITSGPLTTGIPQHIPEVESSTVIAGFGRRPLRIAGEAQQAHDENAEQFRARVALTTPDFFNIFNFPVVKGQTDSLLSSPSDILITESTATALFGNENPLGKELQSDGDDIYIVKAVLKDVPYTSSIQFGALMKFRPEQNPVWWDSWENVAVSGFLKLKEGVDAKAAENKIIEYAKANNFAEIFTPKLQPLSQMHLESNHLQYDFISFRKNNIIRVRIYAATAIIILLVAMFNFINLSSARASMRAREVGLRKVVGARKHQLIVQFLGESVLTTFFAMIIVIIVYQLTLPRVQALLGKELPYNLVENPLLILILLGIGLLTGLVSGIYPALILSGFQPIAIMRGNFSRSRTGTMIRRGLVILQFGISIALVVCVLMVNGQIRFLHGLDLGYNREHVLAIPTFHPQIRDHREALIQKIKALPGVSSVGSGFGLLTGGGGARYEILPEGGDESKNVMALQGLIDADILNTMEIEVLQGRGFSSDRQGDADNSVLINETAVRQFGWTDPVGKQVTIVNEREERLSRQVVGVVKDVYLRSLRQTVEPMFFRYTPEPVGWVFAKLLPETITKTRDQVIAALKEIAPDVNNEPFFYDEAFDNQFRQDRAFASEISIFAGLAIVVACLGLFGLTSFSVEQRRNEIAVRKILGSSEERLTTLLVFDFLRWVLIACLIAWPMGYLTIRIWQKEFIFYAPLTPWPFLISTGGAVVLAVLTVIWQSIRASRTNPADVLRVK